VRGFEPEDIDAWARIAASPSAVDGSLRLPFTSRESFVRGYEELSEATRLLVAESERGDVLGIGSLTLDEHARRRHAGRVGLLVAEEHAGKGIGSALLDALIALGEGFCHLARLELEVWVDNRRAIALYRSRRFLVEGVLRAHSLKGGKLVDAFAMARLREQLGYERVLAEDIAQQKPPALTAGGAPSPETPENGDGHDGNGGGASRWRWGRPPRGGGRLPD
jgi:putative acetyltransferase